MNNNEQLALESNERFELYVFYRNQHKVVDYLDIKYLSIPGTAHNQNGERVGVIDTYSDGAYYVSRDDWFKVMDTVIKNKDYQKISFYHPCGERKWDLQDYFLMFMKKYYPDVKDLGGYNYLCTNQ